MKTFPKLYQSHDDVDNQPCLRIDDAVGRRVLNVTLSGYMPGVEPSPAEWAAHVERACNNHERLVEALKLAEEHIGRGYHPNHFSQEEVESMCPDLKEIRTILKEFNE